LMVATSKAGLDVCAWANWIARTMRGSSRSLGKVMAS
jgi:hypothetical protein